MTKSLLHQHKAVFLTQIVKINDLKAPNLLCNLIFLMSFTCQSYVLVYHSYVIRMSLICTRMSFVCHLYVLVCNPYVTRMYWFVIRMSLVCTRMSSVCHLFVVLPWTIWKQGLLWLKKAIETVPKTWYVLSF